MTDAIVILAFVAVISLGSLFHLDRKRKLYRAQVDAQLRRLLKQAEEIQRYKHLDNSRVDRIAKLEATIHELEREKEKV